MSEILKKFIKKNKENIKDLINNNKEDTIIDLILSKENKKYLLEIRNENYKLRKINSIVYSKVFDIIKMDGKIGIIRESGDYKLYEWLKTDVSKEDINLVKNQIKIMNSIIGKNKIKGLDDIWIKKVNKSFPVVIKGTNIKHNGHLIFLINLGRKKASINNLNKEIRLKNLKNLYSKEELKGMYSNLFLEEEDIFENLIKNKIDNELILRRIECNQIAKLI